MLIHPSSGACDYLVRYCVGCIVLTWGVFVLCSGIGWWWCGIWVQAEPQYFVNVMFFCTMHFGTVMKHKTHSSTHKTADTESCKTYHTAYITAYLKMKPRLSKHIGDKRNKKLNINLDNYAFRFIQTICGINPLQTKRRPLYLKPQSVPRCKHFSSRL